ncbi:MAG: hypothetical protein N2Z62_13025 [Rhodobacteraceae bacterium]|nr:hypothetical protein [Paracoccaceae bacterium]
MDFFFAHRLMRAGRTELISGSFLLGVPEGLAAVLPAAPPEAKAAQGGPAGGPGVTWILPPRESLFHGPIRSAARQAGYATLELDDLTCRGPGA